MEKRPEPTKTEVRALLRRLLASSGLSQAKLARRVGRSPAWMSAFLAGDGKKVFLDFDDLCAVVAGLGLDMRSFWALLYEGLPATPQRTPAPPRDPVMPEWTREGLEAYIETLIGNVLDRRATVGRGDLAAAGER